MLPISRFHDEYEFLSNFPRAFVVLDGLAYPTVEHAYQAAKTLDIKERVAIQYASTAGEAKKMGRKVQMREDWDAVKDEVMLSLLRQKFIKDNHFGPLLLETIPRELIEGNYWHDNYWGDCKCPKCPHIQGQNKLGQLLEQVRKEMIN